MERTLNSKPHSIKAIKLAMPFKQAAPQWLIDAYHEGRARATINSKDCYMTLYQGENIHRGYNGQWLCINESGKMFFMTQEEIERGFTGYK